MDSKSEATERAKRIKMGLKGFAKRRCPWPTTQMSDALLLIRRLD